MPFSRLVCAMPAAAVALVLGTGAVRAQDAALQPIPAAECQTFAGRIQDATGFKMTASEDDFTDIVGGSDGRSCHISGSASGQAFAAPNELIGRIAGVFGDWKDDPARSDEAPSGADKGYVNGNRVASVQVSWEPGPGAVCSDKQSLSACNIQPQQKLWTAVVDIAVKAGK